MVIEAWDHENHPAVVFVFLFLSLFLTWLCCTDCSIIVPQSGIEPAVKTSSANHWTTTEFPVLLFLQYF